MRLKKIIIGVLIVIAESYTSQINAKNSSGIFLSKNAPLYQKVVDGIWVVRTSYSNPKNSFEKLASRVPSNIFIIDAGEHLILFDAGYEGDDNLKNLNDCLRAMRRNPGEISHLIISHWHIDHTGLASSIKEISGCKVVAQRNDVAFMTHEKKLSPNEIENRAKESGFFSRILVKILKRAFNGIPIQGPPFQVDLIVDDDFQLSDWVLIHTPGHSAGSLTMWNPSRKILIVGNWAKALEKTEKRKKSKGEGLIDKLAPDTDPDALIQSIQRLRELEPKLILFSHSVKFPVDK